MDIEEALYWLHQGTLRQQLLLSIHQPHTVGQLSRRLHARIGHCARAMRYLVRYQLAMCLTPHHKRNKVYWLTTFGADCQRELTKHHGTEEISHVLPDVDYEVYASICTRHRRVLVKHLTKPMFPGEVRRAALSSEPHQRISNGNARDVMASLVRLGVAEKEQAPHYGRKKYQLTSDGKHMQSLLWRSEEPVCPGILRI